jgi:hypothetical protein
MSILDQKLGSFFREQVDSLVSYAGTEDSLHLLSFDVQVRASSGGGKADIPVILVLQYGRPSALGVVRKAVNVTYDWSWNASVLEEGRDIIVERRILVPDSMTARRPMSPSG